MPYLEDRENIFPRNERLQFPKMWRTYNSRRKLILTLLNFNISPEVSCTFYRVLDESLYLLHMKVPGESFIESTAFERMRRRSLHESIYLLLFYYVCVGDVAHLFFIQHVVSVMVSVFKQCNTVSICYFTIWISQESVDFYIPFIRNVLSILIW